VAALLTGGCGVDEDADGYGPETDCDDLDPTVHPGATEYWDSKDNDCDGEADNSTDSEWFVETEPNDALFEGCYDGAGQWLGVLAPTGVASFVDGSIETVVDQDYDLGDNDCLAFRLMEPAELHLQIQWPEAETDLDFAVWSLWEEDGSKQAFLGSQDTTPLVTGGSSDGAMSADQTIYLWISAYEGSPTTYEVTLWTFWETADASAR